MLMHVVQLQTIRLNISALTGLIENK